MTAELTCPICAAELSVEQLFANEETRAAFGRLVKLSVANGAHIVAYISLFAPRKSRQTLARKVKLLEELLPDITRRAVTRKGRDWAAPPEHWRDAIDQMLDARNAGQLTLPLTSHGYLHEILVSMADKVEATEESVDEAVRRHREHRSGAAQVGMVLDDLMAAAPPPAPRAPVPAPAPGMSPLVRKMRAELEARAALTTSTPVSESTQ